MHLFVVLTTEAEVVIAVVADVDEMEAVVD
jgi:hypothetical protein